MALDLEDQEQLDEFKVWWNKNGKLTIGLILIGIIAYAGWQAYQYSEHKKAVEASDVYQQLLQLEPSDTDGIQTAAAKLMDQYAGTPYAGRAAVYLAKSKFATDNIDDAKSQLEWAIANAQETPVKAVASLQLATLYFDAKDYEQAVKVLSGNLDPGYAGLKDDLLGDVLVAQGKTAEAKKAYEAALSNLDSEGRLRTFTQQKLDALGS